MNILRILLMKLQNDKGLALEKKGEYSRAIECYGKAIASMPAAVAYYNRGNAFAHVQRYDLAIRDYREAIEIQPEYSEAYNNLGKLYFQIGQNDLAETNYRMAIQCDPHNHVAINNLGAFYLNVERFDEAIECFDIAVLSHDPRKQYSYFYNRGVAYGQKGNLARAIEDFSMAVKLNPRFADGYCNRGIAHKNNGDIGAANEDFKMADELKPPEERVNSAVLTSKRERQTYKNRSR